MSRGSITVTSLQTCGESMSNTTKKFEKRRRYSYAHSHDDYFRFVGKCRCHDCKKSLKRSGKLSKKERVIILREKEVVWQTGKEL
jgi:hypothetical protein